MPAGADGYMDRLTATDPAADGTGEEVPPGSATSVPAGLASGDGGGNESADTSSAHDATWDAVEDIASATGSDGLGMAMQGLPGVHRNSGYLQSQRPGATAGQEPFGTATDSLQALSAAAGMTVHTAVTLPAQSDGAGMTVRTAVSLPGQQGYAELAGYGAGEPTALKPNAATRQRGWGVDGSQQRSVLDTYAPFTAEQLAARADGLVSTAVVLSGAYAPCRGCHVLDSSSRQVQVVQPYTALSSEQQPAAPG